MMDIRSHTGSDILDENILTSDGVIEISQDNHQSISMMNATYIGLLSIKTGANEKTYYFPLQTEYEFSFSSIKQALFRHEQTLSQQNQLKSIKKCFGLNILELASILQVSRPTVYEWINTEKFIRPNNLKRINSIYEISKKWQKKDAEQLGSYLHKPLGSKNISLFDLLNEKDLKLAEINSYLENIFKIISSKREEKQKQETLLKQHSFKSISKEEREKRLNELDFWD